MHADQHDEQRTAFASEASRKNSAQRADARGAVRAPPRKKSCQDGSDSSLARSAGTFVSATFLKRVNSDITSTPC